jgi:hypothetical protein
MLRATNHAGQFQASVTCHTDTVGGFLKSLALCRIDMLRHSSLVSITLVSHSVTLHHLGLLCFA